MPLPSPFAPPSEASFPAARDTREEDYRLPEGSARDRPRADAADRSLLLHDRRAPPSSVAQDVFHSLSQRGASFFTDLVRLTKHLPAEVEAGLWELVVAGLVTADGFDSLRALMDPRRRRAEGKERTRRPRHSAGRWSLFRTHLPAEPGHRESTGGLAERMARQLLRRYGVVFRDLLQRESLALPWRDLLVQYRRLELRGEIRGGRFVGGFTGEQFAQPEAVEALRTVRRDRDCAAQEIKVSGADPLNLVGIITPGSRVPGVSGNDVIFRDGAPVILPGRQDAAIIF